MKFPSLRFHHVARIALLATISLPSSTQAAEPAQRLPNQIFNRMVYVRTAAKSELFVNMPNHYEVGSPSISPDGKWIAFDAMTIGEKPIRESMLVGIDGTGLRRLADGSAPRWSPDGKRLLISREILSIFSRQFQIYEFEIATGKEELVRDGRFPDWSPDGKKIVFATDGTSTTNSGVHPGSKLWTANADGSSAAELCAGNWPSWSPDGKKIAYCEQVDGKPNEIWTIDLDTKQKTKIGLGFYRAQWASDSKHFFCNGAFPVPGDTTYTHAPAGFSLDNPLKPRFFTLNLDNPWSPCISRDGSVLALVVDSQKRRGEEGP